MPAYNREHKGRLTSKYRVNWKTRQAYNMRGLPQKTNRNVAIVALYICGFPMNDMARLLEMDRRNCQRFIRKYIPKYRGFLMEQISRYMTTKRGYKPSEGNRWNKMLKELEQGKIQNKKITKKN